MANELVRYSRAGDAFHYRWAARRCIRMIRPGYPVYRVFIEGSPYDGKAGEYIIDVSESSTVNGIKEIAYFQLKHSTTSPTVPFQLSDLEDTISGFAKRFSEHVNDIANGGPAERVTFTIVTNRLISQDFKDNIKAIKDQKKVTPRFQRTLEKYTKLTGASLCEFCGILVFNDSEGDYNIQRDDLRFELSDFLAEIADDPLINNIIELIHEHALPDKQGPITREDILKRFGVSSEKDLFPAPPVLEENKNFIKREQHDELLQKIIHSTRPIIIHASGGVGKSVVARQLAEDLPDGSLGLIYDCFGAGQYRNPIMPRHRHRDALVQLSNEMASRGICSPLIPRSSDQDDSILKDFCKRLEEAIACLKTNDHHAALVIIIDAADNAEMAAKDGGDSCFAEHLLQIKVPDEVKIVLLCRTERINLLKSPSTIEKVLLKPFSIEETLRHLHIFFPVATNHDGLEFHRLTNGNPRVQANAVNSSSMRLPEILASLGPCGITVAEQISEQLDHAIATLKDNLPLSAHKNIDAICMGLATLPPLVPIQVLAKIANVDETAIMSFITDLGRPLWRSDDYVQFRDEPVETWFKERFSADNSQINSYIVRIRELALTSSYVAEVLPRLLMQSENYDELMRLSLSEEYLPNNNPIDRRNILVSRLRFAFRAAIRQKKYADAIKLSLLAGEEVAGTERQTALQRENIDLISLLQASEKVQELAYERKLHSGWVGSENVFSASLLSYINDFKGDARGYLRATINWLDIYLNENKNKKDHRFQEKLQYCDIAEIVTVYYNLFGAQKAVGYILSWSPQTLAFEVTKIFVSRLIDNGKIDEVIEIAHLAQPSPYMIIAIADELISIGKFLPSEIMKSCLYMLSKEKTCIPVPVLNYGEKITPAILSFCEACLKIKNYHRKIIKVIGHYLPQQSCRAIADNYMDEPRRLFMRGLAIQNIISGELTSDPDKILSCSLIKNDKKSDHDEIKEFKQVIARQFPWFLLRAQVLAGSKIDFLQLIQNAEQLSKNGEAHSWREYDRIPYENSCVHFEVLALSFDFRIETELKKLEQQLLNRKYKFYLPDRLRALRAAYRIPHLVGIRQILEESCRESIKDTRDEGPDEIAKYYIGLARAVLSEKKEDSAAYFDYAVEVVSKFGDEIIERWEALVILANRQAEGKIVSHENIYRFIRCAELIGENVDREKYFDRDGAMQTCAKLCFPAALAALSRWRDRDVGCFERQLFAIVNEAVDNGTISPAIAWSISTFSIEYRFEEFTEQCLKKETDLTLRQHIFDAAVRELSLVNTSSDCWMKIKNIGQELFLRNDMLQKIVLFHDKQKKKEVQQSTDAHISPKRKTNWKRIFSNLDLTSPPQICVALTRFKNIGTSSEWSDFWQQFFTRIEEKDAAQILKTISDVNSIDMYDMRYAFAKFPPLWKQKPSVQRNWDSILTYIFIRFAGKLSKFYYYLSFFESFDLSRQEKNAVHYGIIKGLAESSELFDSRSFFGVANICISFISPQEASQLLDFGISRFETHIDRDFADGQWEQWLIPPVNNTDAFAGLIWSALGSPRSTIRWNAAHCIRRIAAVGGQQEIDALISWMKRDTVEAFGSKKYPFYNLHAKQYLLIAMARIAIDNPAILQSHSKVFTDLALNDISHILIQKYAKEIALSIEKKFPHTYDEEIVKQLAQIGVSQLPVKHLKKYTTKPKRPCHKNKGIPSNINFSFGLDFPSYWFMPLGSIFGITAANVEDLARIVICNDFGDGLESSYTDPRDSLWKKHDYDRETTYSHGSYPLTDDYRFYLSYHAMLIVASNLIKNMPIVNYGESWRREKEWEQWLERHLLTRSDGKWLADMRDPIPLKNILRKTDDMDSWLKSISPDEFFDGLLYERNNDLWMYVHGAWNECDGYYNKEIYITSAFVTAEASTSLLNALSSYENPYEFRLPDFKENGSEVSAPPFVLKGWIAANEPKDKGVDDLDVHAGKIYYPPPQINHEIIQQFEIHTDSTQKEWYLPKENFSSIVNETWSTGFRQRLENDPVERGNRVSVSLNFIEKLCAEFNSELIIEISIKHQKNRAYYGRYNDNGEYKPPFFKIYLFSADGRLRDTGENFQLRANNSQ